MLQVRAVRVAAEPDAIQAADQREGREHQGDAAERREAAQPDVRGAALDRHAPDRQDVLARGRHLRRRHQAAQLGRARPGADHGPVALLHAVEPERGRRVVARGRRVPLRLRRVLRDQRERKGRREPGPHRREPHVRVPQHQGELLLARRRDPICAGGALRRAQDADAQAVEQGQQLRAHDQAMHAPHQA